MAKDTHSTAPEFFGNVSSYYARKQYTTGKRTFINVRHAHVIKLIETLRVTNHIQNGSKILDAGCGPGYLTRDLLNRNYDVDSIDISWEMLEIASVNAGLSHFRGQQGSIEQMPYPNDMFDMVCSCGVIEYLPTLNKAIDEFYRVLKPGGILILATTNPRSPANYLFPLMEWAKKSKLIQQLFDVAPRNFKVTLHSPTQVKSSLHAVGFELFQEKFFYLMPFPRPIDKFLPFVEPWMEWLSDTPIIKQLGEGHLSVAIKFDRTMDIY